MLSIKCYVCKEPDQKCRDPFQNDTIFLKDCSQVGMGNATMCRKYMWESKEDGEESIGITDFSFVSSR